MSNQPSHIVYAVRDGEESGKGYWTRIGAAWGHADGKGFSVTLELVPLDGRLVLRAPEDKPEPEKKARKKG